MKISKGLNAETATDIYQIVTDIVPDGVVSSEIDGRYIIVICREKSDIDPIVEAFDPASSSSPLAADSRNIARPIVSHLASS